MDPGFNIFETSVIQDGMISKCVDGKRPLEPVWDQNILIHIKIRISFIAHKAGLFRCPSHGSLHQFNVCVLTFGHGEFKCAIVKACTCTKYWETASPWWNGWLWAKYHAGEILGRLDTPNDMFCSKPLLFLLLQDGRTFLPQGIRSTLLYVRAICSLLVFWNFIRVKTPKNICSSYHIFTYDNYINDHHIYQITTISNYINDHHTYNISNIINSHPILSISMTKVFSDPPRSWSTKARWWPAWKFPRRRWCPANRPVAWRKKIGSDNGIGGENMGKWWLNMVENIGKIWGNMGKYGK